MFKPFSDEEISFLIKNYPIKGLDWCAKKLNRTHPSIRQKTSNLKLKQNRNSAFFKSWQKKAKLSKIGKKRPIHSKIMTEKGKKGLLWNQNKAVWTDERKKMISNNMKKYIKNFGHAKGMLGKHHSVKTKKLFSQKRLGKKFNLTEEQHENLSRIASIRMHERIRRNGTIYSRSTHGWYSINGNKFYFRSSWEINYARYLEWLLSKKEIEDWGYEIDTFWFEKIKRGVRSYLPDFKVFHNDGKIEYHEVKGYMDDKSKTKIKRMAKYYPKVKLIIIDKDSYKDIKQYERLFPEAISLKPEIVTEEKVVPKKISIRNYICRMCEKHVTQTYDGRCKKCEQKQRVLDAA